MFGSSTRGAHDALKQEDARKEYLALVRGETPEAWSCGRPLKNPRGVRQGIACRGVKEPRPHADGRDLGRGVLKRRVVGGDDGLGVGRSTHAHATALRHRQQLHTLPFH